MASSLLTTLEGDDEDDVEVTCVIPLNCEKEECDNDMKEAYQLLIDNQYKPSWKSEQSCLSLQPGKRDVFVLQKFEGPGFEHLQDFKCVITGPRCLIHCLRKNLHLPLVWQPTFTAAMLGMVITCSGGGPDVKNVMKKRVELMSGTYCKSFTERTTHVVVCGVSTTKYERAFELSIPVYTHDWINAVWESSLKEYISPTDKKFDRYKCPPFLNLHVCSSGLSIRETERIKNIVVRYGGVFESSLRSKINVLVVKHPKGEKFKYAQSWSIPCVTPGWIDDSVQNGHALPTKQFEVTGGRAASSPTSDKASVTFLSNVSNIHFERSHVDETMNATTSSVASFCPPQVITPVKMPPPSSKRTPRKTPVKTPVKAQPCDNPGDFKHLLSELSLAQTKKAGSFLDGCGVYLLGWNQDEEELLKKILKCSGAARFVELSDSVTHILVGNLEKQFMRTMKSLAHKPYTVNIKWLIQSVTEKGPAVEEPFSCLPSDTSNLTEAPSPLSKKGMALLQHKDSSPQKPLVMQNKQVKESPSKEKQLLAKYMSSESLGTNALSTSALSMPPPPAPTSISKPSSSSHNSGIHNDESNDSYVVESQEDIFKGLNFVIVGIPDKIYPYIEEELIQKHGGRVVPKSFKGVPDYAIVPLTGATLRHTATEIITSLWLESCIEQQSILPVSYYHQPVVLDEEKKPLVGCVLGLSGFSGKERDFILELAATLGAICQDVFAKRSKNNAKASSHLICKTSEKTEKLNAALKWHRPAVYHTWLLACAESGTMIPEKKYLVEPNQVIMPLENINSSTVSVNDSTTPPIKCGIAKIAELRNLSSANAFKTPERPQLTHSVADADYVRSYKPSPNPNIIETPPVPLGITTNPTPGESKRLRKWVNHLPEKLSPPPRRDSTPLHELRRRVLEAHSVTTPEILHLVPIKDGGLYEDTPEDAPESANSLKVQGKLSLRNDSNKTSKNSSGESKSPLSAVACSTPTPISGPNASRKLFNGANQDLGSPIDGQLDKLKKLIATPEVNEDSLSSKSSNLNQLRVVANQENQRVYDLLKDGSQPYSIKWEDPINMKRPSKSDLEESCQQSDVLDIKEKNSAKRKSSESAENAPEFKRSNVEGDREEVQPKSKKEYKFALSHVGDRENISSLISKLGGTLLDAGSYNPDTTHLLLEKSPQRSEKLLAFIASGKWVLHISFLTESAKRGKFLKEEDFEWGNPCNKLMSGLPQNSLEAALSRASYRWRISIANGKCSGAFEGMTFKIYAATEKLVAFSRLIAAGKGRVLRDNNVIGQKDVLVDCAKKSIPCLPVSFLYEHLTVHPCPKPESKVFEDYRVLQEKYKTH